MYFCFILMCNTMCCVCLCHYFLCLGHAKRASAECFSFWSYWKLFLHLHSVSCVLPDTWLRRQFAECIRFLWRKLYLPNMNKSSKQNKLFLYYHVGVNCTEFRYARIKRLCGCRNTPNFTVVAFSNRFFSSTPFFASLVTVRYFSSCRVQMLIYRNDPMETEIWSLVNTKSNNISTS